LTEASPVTLIGWNNQIPDNMCIGEGATIYPNISADQWSRVQSVKAGEVLK